jgi:hypothetical protein
MLYEAVKILYIELILGVMDAVRSEHGQVFLNVNLA